MSTIEKVLNILIDSEDYVTGESIGAELDITRIAINKHIVKLKELGLLIESSRKGYKYIASDTLTEYTLRRALRDYGVDIDIFVKAVDSTNSEAKRLCNIVNSDFLIVAPYQLKGRGRIVREFVSNEGGVYMTLCYNPSNLEVTDSLKIVLLTGLAVARSLEKITSNVEIKWPNDIFVSDKKISGILLESVLNESIVSKIILGIGINVNNTLPGHLDEIATSLSGLGVRVNREDLIGQVMSTLCAMLDEYSRTGFKTFEQEYIAKCRSINRQVTVKSFDSIITGKGIGLSEEGYLMVENNDGIHKIIYGDVEA